MSRLGFGLIAILAVALGLLVGTFNSSRVVLDLVWVQVQWPLGLLILSAFAIGVVLGLGALYLSHVLPLRLKLRRAQAEAEQAAADKPPGPDA
jgi:uncharacterized integral membrane protein